MKLTFKSNKIKRCCEDPSFAQKIFGSLIATKLVQRVNELESAVNLLDIKRNPAARLHALDGARKDQFAIDLVGPFRLIIKPISGEDVKTVNIESITIVRIEEVIDYHGKQKR